MQGAAEMRTPTSCRLIRDDVRTYCEGIGLGEAQILACIDTALIVHSVEAGKKTAERLLQKNRARELRMQSNA